MMKRFFLTLLVCLIVGIQVEAQTKYQGFAEKGGKQVKVSPTTKYTVQESYPSSTVTVYLAGTVTPASIYSNKTLTTPKSNPFTVGSDAYYSFYTTTGVNIDIKFSGTGIATPFTFSDLVGIPSSSSSANFNCDAALGCFDPNATPYSCVTDNLTVDSVACVQSVFNAAAAWSVTNGKPADIYFDDGAYSLKADLVTTSGCYSQICFPSSTYTLPGAVRVSSKSQRLFGIGHFNSNSNAGLIFISTRTGKSYSVSGWPSVFGAKDPIHGIAISDQNWISYHFKGVSIRQQSNPSMASVDARMLNRFIIEDSRIDVVPATYALPANYTYPTNPTGVGVLMPINNADSGQYRGWFEISGYYGCMGISETTSLTGHIQNITCRVGEFLQVPYYHTPYLAGSIYDVRSEHGIACIDPSIGVAPCPVGLPLTYLNHVHFNALDFENADAGYNFNRLDHIYDPTNNLRVTGNFSQGKQNTGNHGLPLIKVGGRNVDVGTSMNLFGPDYGEQRVVWDTFDAADGTLVSARKPNVNKAGGSWAVLGGSGNFTITNNHAIGNNAVADNDVVIETGIADCTIISKFYFSSVAVSQGVGVIFRATDGNNKYWVELAASLGTLTIYKKAGGLVTTLHTTGLPAAYFPNLSTEEHSIRVNLTGNNIQVILDYAVIYNGTDSFNNTATKHGIHSFGINGTTEEFKVLR